MVTKEQVEKWAFRTFVTAASIIVGGWVLSTVYKFCAEMYQMGFWYGSIGFVSTTGIISFCIYAFLHNWGE